MLHHVSAYAATANSHPVQTVLHYALCFIRDVSRVSDQHRRARWCRPYTLWSTFNIVDQLHAAAAAHKERAFSYAGPSAWDGLSEDLRAVAAPAEFRKQLKAHFFNAAYNVYWHLLSSTLSLKKMFLELM